MEANMANGIQFKNSSQVWSNMPHQSWEDVLNDGWHFEYLTKFGTAIFSRNGYFDELRQI